MVRGSVRQPLPANTRPKGEAVGDPRFVSLRFGCGFPFRIDAVAEQHVQGQVEFGRDRKKRVHRGLTLPQFELRQEGRRYAEPPRQFTNRDSLSRAFGTNRLAYRRPQTVVLRLLFAAPPPWPAPTSSVPSSFGESSCAVAISSMQPLSTQPSYEVALRRLPSCPKLGFRRSRGPPVRSPSLALDVGETSEPSHSPSEEATQRSRPLSGAF